MVRLILPCFQTGCSLDVRRKFLNKLRLLCQDMSRAPRSEDYVDNTLISDSGLCTDYKSALEVIIVKKGKSSAQPAFDAITLLPKPH